MKDLAVTDQANTVVMVLRFREMTWSSNFDHSKSKQCDVTWQLASSCRCHFWCQKSWCLTEGQMGPLITWLRYESPLTNPSNQTTGSHRQSTIPTKALIFAPCACSLHPLQDYSVWSQAIMHLNEKFRSSNSASMTLPPALEINNWGGWWGIPGKGPLYVSRQMGSISNT